MFRKFELGEVVRIAGDYTVVSDGIIIDIKGIGPFKKYAVSYKALYSWSKIPNLVVEWLPKSALVKFNQLTSGSNIRDMENNLCPYIPLCAKATEES